MNHSVSCAMTRGALRFGFVSVLSFLPWAEGELMGGGRKSEGSVFYQCGLFFLIFSELFLPALVNAPDRFRKFNRAFPLAFIGYAVAWSAAWFATHSRTGEWLGLAAGCAAFAWILGRRLGAKTGMGRVILVLFIAHSIGYFLGGFVFGMARNPPSIFSTWEKKDIWALAKLSWGLFYGLGFGAGIGYAFHQFQLAKDSPKAAESVTVAA